MTPGHVAREWANDLDDEPTASDIQSMTALAKSSVSVAERLQHRLHPLTSFGVIPLFALANAGVRIDLGSLGRPGPRAVATGVIVGLVAGKAIGISLSCWIAVRLRFGELPDDMTWAHLIGVAVVAGIGFTVSLLISGLAFGDSPALESAAKTGVLTASLLAAVVGSALLHRAARQSRGSGADMVRGGSG
jgi:NhaA family Na+:H+ antiporter